MACTSENPEFCDWQSSQQIAHLKHLSNKNITQKHEDMKHIWHCYQKLHADYSH